MLTHYFELRAIPQIEMTETEVMNQLMQSLHRALVNYNGKIGLSFPCYARQNRQSMGGIIRLFGSAGNLQQLSNEIKQNSNIRDYALAMDIQTIPEKLTGYIEVSRVRSKGQSAIRRAEKRLTAQGKWSPDVHQAMIEKWGSTRLNYPYFHLTSQSTGQHFMLWVNQKHCKNPVYGEFNAYGMSQVGVTVPDF